MDYFWFFYFQKSIQKQKQIALLSLPRLWNESGATVTQMKIQTHLSKALLLNCRCQRLIYHTLSAFQNPVWHYYSKQKVSRICISQGCFIFPARSHLSKPPTQIWHQHCVLLSERHSDAVVSVYGSLISHICDNISPWVGCGASLIRSRFYCCFSSLLAVTERSSPSLYRAKLCFYTMSTPMQDHLLLPSAETEGHKWNITVNVCVNYFLFFFFLDQRQQMACQLAMYRLQTLGAVGFCLWLQRMTTNVWSSQRILINLCCGEKIIHMCSSMGQVSSTHVLNITIFQVL